MRIKPASELRVGDRFGAGVASRPDDVSLLCHVSDIRTGDSRTGDIARIEVENGAWSFDLAMGTGQVIHSVPDMEDFAILYTGFIPRGDYYKHYNDTIDYMNRRLSMMTSPAETVMDLLVETESLVFDRDGDTCDIGRIGAPEVLDLMRRIQCAVDAAPDMDEARVLSALCDVAVMKRFTVNRNRIDEVRDDTRKALGLPEYEDAHQRSMGAIAF